mgnify:CR=1 FL=1
MKNRADTSQAALVGVRRLIDGIDDAMLALIVARRRMVSLADKVKQDKGIPARDLVREREVILRARRLGNHFGLPEASSDRLMTALIHDACGQQGIQQNPEDCSSVDTDQGANQQITGMLHQTMNSQTEIPAYSRWVRLLPPPSRLSPFLRRIPIAWQASLLEASMLRVLGASIVNGALELLEDRRLGIEVSDLNLRWVVVLRDGRMHVCSEGDTAEATVRGTATDLLLLASRREDADTLFFQRRLVLTGDTELGLTARNLLDQLPWQEIPLGFRILMHRGSDFVMAARNAYHGKKT